MYSVQPGTVYLVGAGPGDPGLITVRGLDYLTQAQVVVYDRLVAPELLARVEEAELVDVGKLPDHQTMPQEEINSLLIQKASQGQVVVRLKGGDPFVFGRGGEEAFALFQAGVPFEIVPGVTSAVAVPAYAGIPVTHRGLAASVAFVTGHRQADQAAPAICWQHLAHGVDTLVFLMGVQSLPKIVANLVENGRSPETPVAVIQSGTLSRQEVVVGTLNDILQKTALVKPPAITVVGEVVRLQESLRWFKADPKGMSQ